MRASPCGVLRSRGCAAESQGLTKAHRSGARPGAPPKERQAGQPPSDARAPPPSWCRRARSGAARPASSLPSRQLRRTVQGVQKANDNERSRWWRARARAVLSPRNLRRIPPSARSACRGGSFTWCLRWARRPGAWQRPWRAKRRARRKSFAGPRLWRGTCRPASPSNPAHGVLGAPNTARSTLKPPIVNLCIEVLEISQGPIARAQLLLHRRLPRSHHADD